MATEMTVAETSSIFQEIAMATGLPSLAVEVGFIVLALIIILLIIMVVSAILRIRKEMISLNFKISYIARLLKRQIEGAALKKEPEKKVEPKDKNAYKKDEWKL